MQLCSYKMLATKCSNDPTIIITDLIMTRVRYKILRSLLLLNHVVALWKQLAIPIYRFHTYRHKNS